MGQRWDRPRRRGLVGCLALLLMLASCSSSSPAVCDPIIIEDLDPLSSQHLIVGAEVTYLTDPPTSGPHLGAASLFGAQASPISRPMQVTILESGRTLVQYDRSIDSAAVAALEQIAGEQIVTAPADDLAAPVVVTRWRAKAICTAVSTDAIRHIAERTDLPPTESDVE